MNVKLISHTQPVSINADTIQDLIAYCARVSNPANQMNKETTEKLLNYLMKHKHWSPFEMVNVCMEIETTRDIAHQIVRHRSFAFQEFSQRYANVGAMGDMFENREARLQDSKNRQNSIETEDDKLQFQWNNLQNMIMSHCKDAYDWAIEKGIAKEQARVVLPEGLTKTRLYMNGSVRSWIHYIELRSDNGTQKEHREVALACAKELSKIFPQIGYK